MKEEVKPVQPAKKFVDVKEDAWYSTPINYVTQRKLMNGVANDKFDPSEKATRAMIITILHNNP